MKKITVTSAFTAIFLFFTMVAQAKGVPVKTAYNLTREPLGVIQIADTIPAPVRPVEVAPAKTIIAQPVASVIKSVPKARKVSVPKPVVVKVKPVKIIKPKISRPILNIL